MASGSASRIFQASSSFFWRRRACALLHGEAPVGLAVRRQLGEELVGVLGAQEHGKARLRLLLLVLRQQRDHAADDGGALVALAGPAAVVEQQAIEAALVVGLGEQPADALEEGRLEARRDVELDPGLLRQRLGLRLVLVGQVRAGQRGEADGGAGLGVGEEGLDLRGAGGAVEQRLLGALGEQPAVGPGRVGVEEGANLRRRAISATVDDTSRPACARRGRRSCRAAPWPRRACRRPQPPWPRAGCRRPRRASGWSRAGAIAAS